MKQQVDKPSKLKLIGKGLQALGALMLLIPLVAFLLAFFVILLMAIFGS